MVFPLVRRPSWLGRWLLAVPKGAPSERRGNNPYSLSNCVAPEPSCSAAGASGRWWLVCLVEEWAQSGTLRARVDQLASSLEDVPHLVRPRLMLVKVTVASVPHAPLQRHRAVVFPGWVSGGLDPGLLRANFG